MFTAIITLAILAGIMAPSIIRMLERCEQKRIAAQYEDMKAKWDANGR